MKIKSLLLVMMSQLMMCQLSDAARILPLSALPESARVAKPGEYKTFLQHHKIQMHMALSQGDSMDDYLETNNPLHVALLVPGYIVLNDAHSGNYEFTRLGDLTINSNGFLSKDDLYVVNWQPGKRYMQLPDPILNAYPTSRMQLDGNLSDKPMVTTTLVYDSMGNEHQVEIDVTPAAIHKYAVKIKDDNNNIVATGELLFSNNGMLDDQKNLDSITIVSKNDGTDPLNIAIFFHNVTDYSYLRSSLGVSYVDGFAAGELSTVRIDVQGMCYAIYSNGIQVPFGAIEVSQQKESDLTPFIPYPHVWYNKSDSGHVPKPSADVRLLVGYLEKSQLDIN